MKHQRTSSSITRRLTLSKSFMLMQQEHLLRCMTEKSSYDRHSTRRVCGSLYLELGNVFVSPFLSGEEAQGIVVPHQRLCIVRSLCVCVHVCVYIRVESE